MPRHITILPLLPFSPSSFFPFPPSPPFILTPGARAMLRLYAGGEEDTALRLDNCNIDIEIPGIFEPNRPQGEYKLDLDGVP